MIDMDARGNKLSPCKIQINILKNKIVIKLLELRQLWLKKTKKKQRIQQCCYYNTKREERVRELVVTFKIVEYSNRISKNKLSFQSDCMSIMKNLSKDFWIMDLSFRDQKYQTQGAYGLGTQIIIILLVLSF